jgi:hypothetical protein
MPLKGTAFLAIWHDIEAHGELEYNAWQVDAHLTRRPAIRDHAARRPWSLDCATMVDCQPSGDCRQSRQTGSVRGRA